MGTPSNPPELVPVPLDEQAWRLVERVMSAVTDYAVFVLDPQGRVLTWNTGAERIKGYARSEILGSHFSRFYPPQVIERGVPDRELETAAAKGRLEDEGWRVRKDGTRFWASVVITALRDADGVLRGFLKITRDITARRKQEQALRESEERFRLLVEGVSDYAIYMLDSGGHVMSWNAGAERIKGYAPQEVLGRHVSMFYPPEEVAAGLPERLLETARTGGRAEEEGWRVRKDGSRFWAGATLTRLLDPDGRLRGFAKVTCDQSQRRRAEELEETGRRADEFLAMLSHELRNPLAPIQNAVTLMAERTADDPTVSWARDVIGRQTQHLGRLVDDLLDISRITLGKIRLERKDVGLADVVHHALELGEPLSQARKHRIDVRLPDEPIRVTGDATRLSQVVTNLLTNAAKYTPDGGVITLAVAREGRDATIRVRDTGVGMGPELLDRVFDLFAQGERGLDRAEGGLGVGLTLSRRLVELHGGTLEGRSEGPGRGSEFIIRLPLASPPPDTAETAMGEGGPAGRCERVLVVDDNPDSAESTAMLLRLWGLDVRTAADGPEGLRQAAAFRPNCVILDLGLPRMDGYEVAERIRQMPDFGREVILVALTGYGQPQDRARTHRAGFDHHLVKPVDLAHLRALLLGPAPSATAGPVVD